MKKFLFLFFLLNILTQTVYAADEPVLQAEKVNAAMPKPNIDHGYPLSSLGGLPSDLKNLIIQYSAINLNKISAISREFNTLSKRCRDHKLVLSSDRFIKFYKKYLCPKEPWTTRIIEGAKRYEELHNAAERVANYLASNNKELRRVFQDHQKPLDRIKAVKELLNDPENDLTSDEKELLEGWKDTTKAIHENFKFFIYKAKTRSQSWDVLIAGTNAQVDRIAGLYGYQIRQNWLGKCITFINSYHHNPYNHALAALGFVAFYFILEHAFNSWRDERASYYSSDDFVKDGFASRVVGTSCSSFCGSATINVPSGELSSLQKSYYAGQVAELLGNTCTSLINPISKRVFDLIQEGFSTMPGWMYRNISTSDHIWLETSSASTHTGTQFDIDAYTYDPYCPAHATIQTYRVMVYTAIAVSLFQYLKTFLESYVMSKFNSR